MGRKASAAADPDALAEALQRAGYGTHAVVANGAVGREFYFDQGFETFLESWKLPPPAGSDDDADPNGAENVTRLALAAAAKMDPAKPVSYTHLTLPTNREV